MNKSFSKIRHIQESNKMLEKRLLESEETEFKPIDDSTTLGNAIVQCYSDNRARMETEELIESRRNSRRAKSLIEEIQDLYLNMSAFGKQPEKLGDMYFDDKDFVRSIQEICNKYNIPYIPR
jgi:hypothetical protein